MLSAILIIICICYLHILLAFIHTSHLGKIRYIWIRDLTERNKTAKNADNVAIKQYFFAFFPGLQKRFAFYGLR